MSQEALRLADEIEQSVSNPHLYWQGKAAAELRRLHEVNQELLNAAKWCIALCEEIDATETNAYAASKSAIKKATRETA